MPRLTKIETIRRHRAMWRRLAADPDLHKNQATGAETPLQNHCWLCEYVYWRADARRDKMEFNVRELCYYCPLEWPVGSSYRSRDRQQDSPCMISWFRDWMVAKTARRRRNLALLISNLKERKIRKAKK